MDDKDRNNEPSAVTREAYHNAAAPSPEARTAVERKLLLRFTRKKEAGE